MSVFKSIGNRIHRYRRKWREDGPRALVTRRLRAWKQRWQMDNWLVGRLVELRGNEVRIAGLRFSVDNPNITTRQKSTMHYGIYELPELDFIRRFVPPSLPVVEFGGCVGVVSCVTNRKLQRPADHVVVEANTGMVPTLERNRDRNGCSFTVMNAAVAYSADSVEFFISDCFLCSSTSGATARSVTVPSTTLASVLERYGFRRVTLIADIEGAEAALVEHEGDVLRRAVEWLVLETHPRVLGATGLRTLLTRLHALGFAEVCRSEDTVVFRNGVADDGAVAVTGAEGAVAR